MHDTAADANADANADDDPIADLRSEWAHLVGDHRVLDGVVRRHREHHRRYHTLDHVVAVVRGVGDLCASESVEDRGAIVAAAWYHDAVYEPRSPANERASARLARRDLTGLGWPADRADRVGSMIEGTAHHTDPNDVDTAVLYDADLAILGATPADYAIYVAEVRAEYAHVDDESWRTGRSDVLDAIIGRREIYSTATGSARWEAAARSNLASELADLRP